MTGPSLDLDALRKKAEKALILLGRGAIEGSPTWCDVQDVFALIDEQRERISTLEEALRRLASVEGFEGAGYVGGETFAERELRARGFYAERALAGSPAENKEPS